ncbi:MAG TPA: DUF5678 domain-containing protein [Candidatus Methylomirabilis sp.]|nr:DUF5678 domain-containing protein [Candidatus Methylomirabilis sp.]
MAEKQYPPVPPLDPWYVRDVDWAYANYNALAAAHPNQWVAVVDERVVAAGVDLGEVGTEAARVAGRQDVAVIFVERGIHVYDHSSFGSDSR